MDLQIWNIFWNKSLVAALLAQVTSQIFKIFIPLFYGKKPDIKKFLDYGDFPSAHTAFITAVTISLALSQGWHSPIFALAVVTAGIVIYDIIKMRKALEINIALTEELMKINKLKSKNKSPQFKGHSVFEVVSGIVWGMIWAILVQVLYRFILNK